MNHTPTLTQHIGLGRAVRRRGWSLAASPFLCPAASLANATVAGHPLKRLAIAF